MGLVGVMERVEGARAVREEVAAMGGRARAAEAVMAAEAAAVGRAARGWAQG